VNWWTQVGNYMTFFDETPALAVDMALHGPNPNFIGYGLAFGLQSTPETIDVYPQEGSFTEPGV
jgi:hypothetical protein